MLEARVSAQRFGRYTLLTKLASGGMASVFLAKSRGEHGFARLFAIKIIHPHLLDQPEFLARFLHEGRLASQIRHPHVVSVFDVGEAEGTPYLVLDYVRGASLAELVQEAFENKEPPSLSVACAIVAEALDGLHAVHSAVDEKGQSLGLIHRDVSPHNILVSGDGVSYVTDLGIARARGVALTQGTGLLGKAGYISPEQLAKEPLTSKVDLFAMGVVLWELLTLQRLFEDLESEVPMLTGTFKLVPPSHFNPAVPPALDRFVASLLARSPDARPRSAGEAAHELGRIVPPAPRGEISEWVQAMAGPRLDRLDALLRQAADASIGMSELPPELGSGRKLSWPVSASGPAPLGTAEAAGTASMPMPMPEIPKAAPLPADMIASLVEAGAVPRDVVGASSSPRAKTPAPPARDPSARRAARRQKLWMAIAAVIVAGAGVGFAFGRHQRPAPVPPIEAPLATVPQTPDPAPAPTPSATAAPTQTTVAAPPLASSVAARPQTAPTTETRPTARKGQQAKVTPTPSASASPTPSALPNRPTPPTPLPEGERI